MILLVSCNMTVDPYPVYPLGLSIVAEAARREGYSVAVRDMLLYEGKIKRLIDFINREKPEIIGLSLRNIDTIDYYRNISSVSFYKKVVESIKKTTDAPVILGGSAFTIYPEEIMEECRADYGVVGEGEKLFCDLVSMIKKGCPPDSRILRSNSYIDGQNLIPVKREKVLADYYFKHGGMLNIQTKRGCPHRCVYCSYPNLEGGEYRFNSVKGVVDEIEKLIHDYSIDFYSITDSVFNDIEGNYLLIAKELVKRGISTSWMCYLRPGKFKEEEVELLKLSGLTAVEWGTDCSTDTTLKGMNKRFFWRDVVESNDLFAAHGIANSHFIIFGGPLETTETVLEGLDNLEKLDNSVIFATVGVRIYPGTPIYKIALKEGRIKENQNLLDSCYYFSSGVSPGFIREKIVESFGDRDDRVYPPDQHVEKIKAFHKMGYSGPVWNLLLGRKKTRKKK